MQFSLSVHDSIPRDDASIVDTGLGTANDAAAPLHEVEPLSSFARDGQGHVIGGVVGRRWGECCELQQLWVHPEHRSQGIGSTLVRAFETRARERGCVHFYLETFSFQAPDFYHKLGYQVAHKVDVYPHGIVRFLMFKNFATDEITP